MNESTSAQCHCSHCQAELPDHHVGPCPQCGKTGKTVSIGATGTIETAGRLSWEKRREFLEKRPGVLAVVIAITVASPFLGLVLAGWFGVVIGLALSGVAYFIGPLALTKIIEIERG